MLHRVSLQQLTDVTREAQGLLSRISLNMSFIETCTASACLASTMEQCVMAVQAC